MSPWYVPDCMSLRAATDPTYDASPFPGRLGAASVLLWPRVTPGPFLAAVFFLTMYVCASSWALRSWGVGPGSGSLSGLASPSTGLELVSLTKQPTPKMTKCAKLPWMGTLTCQ